ncbi:cation:proton antiporter (plasmid) [Deinococcus sp. KNUC1210]|uniref:cation:proton antiporter n=1 Tax=Deinococcus sp. KNUC1210 TaxID=2917691 RepID=UPI001EF0F95E|nr:cation:proton antiporter [Deinococcus sp. KNUC1210]ULH17762.1 cation:proton antiporter [Deinococcus sp. KNUC1210]
MGPLLLSLAAVLGSALLGGLLARAARQPAVIGEMIAVIALGPALLGRLAPAAETALFPEASRPVLATLAQFGVTTFMFIVGLEVHVQPSRSTRALGVTLGSLVLPLLLGMVAAWVLPAARGPATLWASVLFVGAALSVTAVPVLALILQDRGLARTPEASTALSAAASSDVLAWSLLAVIAVNTPGPSVAQRLAALLGLAGWTLLMRTVLTQLERRDLLRRAAPPLLIGASLVAVFVSAAASDAAGLHTIIGPLLLGAAMPRQSGLHALLNGTLGQVVRAALLPFFYLTAGLALDVSTFAPLQVTLTLLLAAVVGKVGGVLLGARLTGAAWYEAWRLGILLNTRGLTELVFLTTGLQLGVIQAPLYTSLVFITLLTTVATAPLLDLMKRRYEVLRNVG